MGRDEREETNSANALFTPILGQSILSPLNNCNHHGCLPGQAKATELVISLASDGLPSQPSVTTARPTARLARHQPARAVSVLSEPPTAHPSGRMGSVPLICYLGLGGDAECTFLKILCAEKKHINRSNRSSGLSSLLSNLFNPSTSARPSSGP